MDPPDHVGEVLPRGTYSKGLTPRRYYGQHTCGNAEIWANGVLYAQRGDLAVWPDGVPKCCQTGPSILCLATEDGADLMEESGTACLAPEEG